MITSLSGRLIAMIGFRVFVALWAARASLISLDILYGTHHLANYQTPLLLLSIMAHNHSHGA